MQNKKRMPSHEIIRRYKEGERDFSNVICQNGEFGAVVLHGIIFRNSDLSYSGFDGTDLTDADFTEAILDWSSFRLATLRRTNFTGARIHWAALNDAIVDQTIFRKADLSWSIMFNTNKGSADWTDANFMTCAFDVSEITAKGIAMHPSQLDKLKNKIPYDIWLRIKFSMQTVVHQLDVASQVNVQRRSYSMPSNVGYNIGGKTGTYSVQAAEHTSYSPQDKYALNIGYVSDVAYVSKKKNKGPPFF